MTNLRLSTTFFAFTIAVFLAGCKSRETFPAAGTLTSDAISDGNSFRNFYKSWHLQITSDVQMTTVSTLQPWLEKCNAFGCDHYALEFADELKQSDGKSVWFDCDNVADRIIDRDLVPKVEASCRSVHAIAVDFWKKNNDPGEFTDKDGKVWKRQ